MPILDKTNKVLVTKYNKFLKGKESASLTQDFRFLLSDKNNNFEIVYLEKNDNLIATMALSIIPIGKKYSVLYCCNGPVCDVYNLDEVTSLVREVDVLAKKHNALMLVMNPEVEESEKLKGLYKRKGFKIYSMLPFDFVKNISSSNMVIDLSGVEESNMLEHLQDKAKYHIETAEKRNVQVKIGTTKREFNRFMKLYEQEKTMDFQAVKTFETFKALLKEFDDDELRIYTTSVNGKVLSSAIVCKYENNIKCLEEAYVKDEQLAVFARAKMHYEIMKWGVKSGCISYNMGQVDEGNNRFKESFATKAGQVNYIGKICKIYKSYASLIYRIRGKKV